jgi:hypothetical protein
MSKSKLWHRRLGHVSIRKLKQLQNFDIISGFSLSKVTNLEICKSCFKKKSYNKVSKRRGPNN